jgi:7-cyano-7-deazaguanine tRNA-ribosyltransferase
MEQYFFDTLVDMIMTAKMHLPLERPLHLFGAGHPFMFPLAIALGCDLFDSAAYAIYAREDRYMTEIGTSRLKELEYFPCSCAVCAKKEPTTVRGMPKQEREKFLARHNLHVSFTEIKRIKQAIIEGRLWEYLEMKCHAHPALLRAFNRLGKYSGHLEVFAAVSKRSGLFFNGSADLMRPEVLRYTSRILERYDPPTDRKVLVLLPQTRVKPYHESREQRRVSDEFERKLGEMIRLINVCTYAAPFGVVPNELDEVYPLSQHEVASPFDYEMMKYVAGQVGCHVKDNTYNWVVLLEDVENWERTISASCKRACKKKGIQLTVLTPTKLWSKPALTSLVDAVKKALGENT